jgi:phospholipid/cholesterol/gamma-HCH transport system substrate-binding protein
MNRNMLETVMGGVVLLVALIFLTFAYSSAGIRSVTGYELNAKFDHVDGIRVGSDVNIAGIKVGAVTREVLDPSSYQVRLYMTVDRRYQLPVDTVANIEAPSLLGENVLSLVPGSDEKMIAAGGAISNTNSPSSLMSLVKQYVFSSSSGSGGSGGGSAAGTDGAAKPCDCGDKSASPAPSGPTPSGPSPKP